MIKFNTQSFIDAIKRIGFYVQGDQPNTFEVRNRSVAHDNDCSDDERDDEFYERYSQKYSKWADRKVEEVNALAKTYGVKIAFERMSEYGILWVVIV